MTLKVPESVLQDFDDLPGMSGQEAGARLHGCPAPGVPGGAPGANGRVEQGRVPRTGVLVIGNGTCLGGKGLGSAIDGFPGKVLRFNDAEFGGVWSGDYGERCEVLAVCAEKLWAVDDLVERGAAPEVVLVTAAPQHYPNLPTGPPGGGGSWAGVRTYTIPLGEVLRCQDALGLPAGRHATTGAVVIWWLLRQGRVVTVSNFDGFRGKHYFGRWHAWDDRGALHFHRPDLEERFLREMATGGSGRVNLWHCYGEEPWPRAQLADDMETKNEKGETNR